MKFDLKGLPVKENALFELALWTLYENVTNTTAGILKSCAQIEVIQAEVYVAEFSGFGKEFQTFALETTIDRKKTSVCSHSKFNFHKNLFTGLCHPSTSSSKTRVLISDERTLQLHSSTAFGWG